ncbi:MAG: hypothetical protein R3B45_00375 [Bdellovibrionota bacterium]
MDIELEELGFFFFLFEGIGDGAGGAALGDKFDEVMDTGFDSIEF